MGRQGVGPVRPWGRRAVGPSGRRAVGRGAVGLWGRVARGPWGRWAVGPGPKRWCREAVGIVGPWSRKRMLSCSAQRVILLRSDRPSSGVREDR